MATTAIRKAPAKRAFVGMAGSPLARVKKVPGSKSDGVLRVPKTPDREAPTAFDAWFDEFGQKHGAIDLDCGLQEYAFDPHLGRGASPNVDSEKPGREKEISPLQELGLSPEYMTDRKKKKGLSVGLLEGDREIKRRRRSEVNWWILDSSLFREFLKSKYDPADPREAEKSALVLYLYYHQSREDEDILEETGAWFQDVKKVKQYRQYIARQGAERFKDSKPETTWHGRRKTWTSGRKCDDPNCQCQRNETSYDFSGRAA
jgi:hypothetical protein